MFKKIKRALDKRKVKIIETNKQKIKVFSEKPVQTLSDLKSDYTYELFSKELNNSQTV